MTDWLRSWLGYVGLIALLLGFMAALVGPILLAIVIGTFVGGPLGIVLAGVIAVCGLASAMVVMDWVAGQ